MFDYGVAVDKETGYHDGCPVLIISTVRAGLLVKMGNNKECTFVWLTL